jgi:pimeloyl-ACP methyl ester carboxylesterase
VRDYFMEVEGVRLHWTEMGTSADLPPVVLLHGLNNSGRSWSQVSPFLATDRRVLMVDLPGHGQSARPDVSYQLDWYAHVVARWIELLKLPKVDVVGHSFGGGIAQMLLLEIPDQIRRIVLIAAGGLGKAVGFWLRLASLPRVVEYLGQPFMAMGTRLALRSAHESIGKLDIAELSRLNALPGTARAFARSVRDVINWRGQRRNFLQRAHDLEKLPPMLVLWGESDTLIPIAQGRAFADMLDGAVFKAFAGCSHYLHNEKPEAVAMEVRAFLDDPTVRSTRLKVPAVALPSAARSRDSVKPGVTFPTRESAR